MCNNRMKIGKESGPSGVAIELFKAREDNCLKYLRNIFNDILFKKKLPKEWILKGDPLNPNGRIKLLGICFSTVRGFGWVFT